jgi:hypothetical protein
MGRDRKRDSGARSGIPIERGRWLAGAAQNGSEKEKTTRERAYNRGMDSTAQNWTCSGCGTPTETPAAEPRQPCVRCGSLARTAHVPVEECITTGVYLKTRAKHRDGGATVVRDITEGDVAGRMSAGAGKDGSIQRDAEGRDCERGATRAK